ncbi:MAG: hypothetical protein HY043_22075 [Verrucomicrobia bacterium]|nr:hypothetical protein [Verrucomicrobiota bacterium]
MSDTKGKAKKQTRNTRQKQISKAPNDALKAVLAKYGTLDYEPAGGLSEVSAIIRHESLLRKGIYASWGGKDCESRFAGKCISALKSGDADFFKKVSHEVYRQVAFRFGGYDSFDPFRSYLLIGKNFQRWREKGGLLPLTLREAKALSPKKFADLSDRYWHKVAKQVGLQFLEGKSGLPKTRNK